MRATESTLYFSLFLDLNHIEPDDLKPKNLQILFSIFHQTTCKPNNATTQLSSLAPESSVFMERVSFNLSRLLKIVSTIALSVLLITTLANQSANQNKQAKSWNLEVSACENPDTQTQDDQDWCYNSTTYQFTNILPNKNVLEASRPALSNKSSCQPIRAPPQHT